MPSSSLAYIIYTSGSTGRPKGVMVTHAQASRLFDATHAWFGFGPDDVWTLFHSYAFDFSVWEIWGALLYGGRLAIVPHLVSRSPGEFHELLVREQVTVLNQTPSAFRQLIQADQSAPEEESARLALRFVIFGGEGLEPATLAPWVERHGDGRPRLVNMYGITETTVHVTYRPLQASDLSGGSRIGQPIPDLRLYLLDADLRPAPAGAPGEIFVGGAGVARGYLGRPELTAERFVPDPFSPGAGERLYRSGDRARRRPDGDLEFLGRIDGQVKIRGFRIEPGEIEAALARHPAVAQAAVVIAGAADDRRLTAYAAVRPGADVTAGELRRFLGGLLPDHMIPSAVAVLPELPLTAHGKVDRRALAGQAEPAVVGAGREAAPLRTPVEEILAGIWAEVLGVETVNPDDDFFGLSGHSLLATQVAYRVRQVLGVDLPLRRLFEGATLSDMALEIEQAARAGQGLTGGSADAPDAPEVPRLEALPAERKAGRLPSTLTQEWVWHLQGGPVGSQLNLALAFRTRQPLDLPALHGAFATIVRRHEALRLRFGESEGAIYAELMPYELPPMPVVDLSALPPMVREAAAVRLSQEDAGRDFDLRRGGLITAQVLKLGESEHALLFNMHHIVSDGWSLEVFQAELAIAYRDLALRQVPALPPLPIQLTDYAFWQRRAVSGDALATQLEHWKRRLEGSKPMMIPTRHPRPEVMGWRTVTSGRLFTGEKEKELRTLARTTGGTMSMLLLTAYFGILHRYSGWDDLVILSAFSGRSRPELSPMIGLFVNTVALRVDLSGSPSFRELVARVRDAVLTAYTHSDVPYARVLATAAPDRRYDRMALSRTILNMLSFPAATSSGEEGEEKEAEAPSGPGLALTELASGEGQTRYDLLLEARESPGSVQCLWIGASDLFSSGDISDLREDFETLLFQALERPDEPLAKLLPLPRYLRYAL